MKRVGTALVTTLFIFCLNCCNTAPATVSLNVNEKPLESLADYHFFKGPLKDLLPNDKVLPYDLASSLFSDYAKKARFVYVPDGKPVPYNDSLVLNLPVGGCFIKNFYYPFDFRDEEKGRRIIETRLLVHREAGWEAHDYIWNDQQTEAKLDVAGDVKTVSWISDHGEKKTIDYIIPNKNQCKGCHSFSNTLLPIGPKVRNLNHDFNYAEGKKNQLEKWAEAGLLSGIPKTADCPKMCNYNDVSADLNLRARAYLDVNCAHCHNPQGPANTSGLFLNYDNQDDEHLGICKTPVAAGRGTGNFLMDIIPGDPDHSILYFRMASTDAGIRMPEVGRTQVHTEGLALIREWIKSQSGKCKAN